MAEQTGLFLGGYAVRTTPSGATGGGFEHVNSAGYFPPSFAPLAQSDASPGDDSAAALYNRRRKMFAAAVSARRRLRRAR